MEAVGGRRVMEIFSRLRFILEEDLESLEEVTC